MSADSKVVAAALIDAIAAQDFEAAEACFTPDARMRALVPSTLREVDGPAAIAARMRVWWGETEHFELLESAIDEVGDRVSIRYRLYGKEPRAGWCVVEQSAYLEVEDGRISTLNLVCSGERPAAAPR